MSSSSTVPPKRQPSASSTGPTWLTKWRETKTTTAPEPTPPPANVLNPSPRPTWDEHYLDLAQQVATRSRDPGTKVGAVIVRPDKTVASMGFNGFPWGCYDDADIYRDRERKLLRTVHAEANAIVTAREPLQGYTAYVTPMCPCSTCAGLLIQAGIKRVVFRMPKMRPEWQASFQESTRMFQEAGVELDHRT